MSTEKVVSGRVVSIEYTLKNDEGEVLDASEGSPLFYLHGAHNIVPGLENALVGKAIGDKVDVRVSPEEGYGEKSGMDPQEIARTSFPEDAELHAGLSFAAETDAGLMPLWITEVADDVVKVTADHPLAGVTLHFAVEVVGIREASESELEHGHAHGPDGHHHH